MVANDDSDSEPTADSREQGVEFGPLEDKLAELEYPIAQSDLLDSLGDQQLEMSGDSKTLREILGDQSEDRTYESADAVHQSVLNMVGAEAVGRTGYSDRGGELPDDSEEADTEEQSL